MSIVPVLIALQLAGAAPPHPNVLELIVKEASTVAPTPAATHRSNRPILLDSASFTRAVVELNLTPGTLSEWHRREPRIVIGQHSDVVQCSGVVGIDRRCWVPDDAVIITIENLSRSGDTVTALARIEFTQRRKSGSSSVGKTRIEYSFVRGDGGWTVSSRTLRSYS